MNTYTNLQNKIVAITGAGGVLCSFFAEECLKLGMSVVLMDINETSIQKVKEDLGNDDKVMAVQCDVLNINSVKEACDKVIQHFGKIDILINGAGGNHPKASTSNEYYELDQKASNSEVGFFDLTTEGFKFVFDLNFMGTFNVTQVFAKHMLKEGCSIINISSASSENSLTKVPAYSAAKSAINNFTKWLAVHFAKTGLRVNAMAPGFFLTKQNEKLLIDKDGNYTPRTTKILSHTPMERLGVPKDLIGTLIYLMDNEMSNFVTGKVIYVDGGFCSYSGV